MRILHQTIDLACQVIHNQFLSVCQHQEIFLITLNVAALHLQHQVLDWFQIWNINELKCIGLKDKKFFTLLIALHHHYYLYKEKSRNFINARDNIIPFDASLTILALKSFLCLAEGFSFSLRQFRRYRSKTDLCCMTTPSNSDKIHGTSFNVKYSSNPPLWKCKDFSLTVAKEWCNILINSNKLPFQWED